MSSDSASLRRRCAAIALVACALLLYEVAITRVLSVVVGYHFAFLSISLAMLGIGAPGVWFALRKAGPDALQRALLASAVTVPGSIALIFKAGALLPRVQYQTPSFADLFQSSVLLAAACVLAAMLTLGCALCLLLLRSEPGELPRVYGADLTGAAAGALLVVPAMIVVPTPLLLAASGFLPLAAAGLLRPRRLRAVVVVAAALAAFLAWGEPFRLRYTKNYVEQGVLYERWTPTARITVFSSPFWRKDPNAAFGWGMGARFQPRPVEQMWIEQDGSAGTPITRVTSRPFSFPHLYFDVTSVVYQIRPAERVCVIGAGGGRDVLTALQSGVAAVDAVELNRGIVGAVSGSFREFSGDLYHLPGVDAFVSEGRSFLTRSRGEYDVVQISLIDSWAATSAGAYALSENYLYTVEALRLYWRRISGRGTISISRWGTGPPKMEIARLVRMAERALADEGVGSPKDHIAVIHAGMVATLLVSRTPWTAEEIARLDRVCEDRGFVRHWPLGPATPRDSISALMLTAGPKTIEDLGFDLSLSTDDRPFFFQTLSVFRSVPPELLPNLSGNEHAVILLRRLLWFVGGLALVLFFLPFALARRLPRAPGFWMGSAYFAAIGLGFMLIQTPWVQRFILYLGHPSYAVTVVLSAMLVGTGLGSMAASRWGALASGAWRWALPAFLVAVNLAAGTVFAATLGTPFAVRAVISVLLIAPAGFLMGFAFPCGVERFGSESLAWFWAVNGFAGVLASVLSLALAMTYGLVAVASLGAAAYVAACALLALSPRS